MKIIISCSPKLCVLLINKLITHMSSITNKTVRLYTNMHFFLLESFLCWVYFMNLHYNRKTRAGFKWIASQCLNWLIYLFFINLIMTIQVRCIIDNTQRRTNSFSRTGQRRIRWCFGNSFCRNVVISSWMLN